MFWAMPVIHVGLWVALGVVYSVDQPQRSGQPTPVVLVASGVLILGLLVSFCGTLAVAESLVRSAYERLMRPPAGHCHGCGYDLRASPDRCPECGRPAAADGPT